MGSNGTRFSGLFFSVLVLTQFHGAEGSQTRALPIQELMDGSDLVVHAEVVIVKRTDTEKGWFYTNGYTKNFLALCRPVSILKEDRIPLPKQFIAKSQDSTMFGDMPDHFKEGEQYLLFLKRGSEGYEAFAFSQSIVPFRNERFDFIYFSIRKDVFTEYSKLRLRPGKPEAWRLFASKVAASGNLDDANEGLGILELLSQSNAPAIFEKVAKKGLYSKSGEVAINSMHRLASMGSESGIEQIVALYFSIKSSEGWKRDPERFITTRDFNSALRAAGSERAKETVRRLHRKYPNEFYLFLHAG